MFEGYEGTVLLVLAIIKLGDIVDPARDHLARKFDRLWQDLPVSNETNLCCSAIRYQFPEVTGNLTFEADCLVRQLYFRCDVLPFVPYHR